MKRLLLAVLVTTGCIPAALPPMRADLGGGVVHASNASAVSDFAASATITPLGGIEETHERPIDFGFGGHLDYARGGYRDVGFHAELAPIIARGPIGGYHVWSITTGVSVRIPALLGIAIIK